MTQAEMQQIILDKYTDTLKDSIDTRKRISKSFAQWFRALIIPPAPPAGAEEEAAPPEGAPA